MSDNNFPHADYGLALGLRIRADYGLFRRKHESYYYMSTHLFTTVAVLAPSVAVIVVNLVGG